MKKLAPLALALSLLASAPAAFAQEVILDAARDNTLYENASGSLSNGAGNFLFAGATISNGVRRAVLAFDVASALPENAEIEVVELTLTMDMTIAEAESVALHALSADWGEGASMAGGQEGGGGASAAGDATWIHTFFDTDFWTTPGGDFTAAPSASQIVDGAGDYVWGSTPEMVADVQGWLNDPSSNFGWILIGNEVNTPPTAKRFGSREGGNGPQLRIVYTELGGPPPTEIPTLSSMVLGLLALLLATAGAVVLRRR